MSVLFCLSKAVWECQDRDSNQAFWTRSTNASSVLCRPRTYLQYCLFFLELENATDPFSSSPVVLSSSWPRQCFFGLNIFFKVYETDERSQIGIWAAENEMPPSLKLLTINNLRLKYCFRAKQFKSERSVRGISFRAGTGPKLSSFGLLTSSSRLPIFGFEPVWLCYRQCFGYHCNKAKSGFHKSLR